MSKKKGTKSYQENLKARSNEARTVRKIVSIIIVSLILIFAIGGISGYVYIKSALDPVDPTNEEDIKVDIPIGSSTSTIAKLLADEGVIKDSRVFRFYIKFKNQGDFQAGEYVFNKSLTLDEIIESLKSGKMMNEPVYTITIPEGKTIAQMADIYSQKLPFSEEDFLEKVNDTEYIEQLIEEYPAILTDDILNPDIRSPLEGYLFAATYEYYQENVTIETVVEDMLDKTVSIMEKYQSGLDESDLAIHEIVTFASLLENEARSVEQRKKISGVFYNRIEEGMRLQTDPTVLYALGGHKEKVLLKDLEIDSPYNTYVVDNLPVGPISNFAENSLAAVFEPEESEYLYFLHDGEGNIHYSATYDEHLILKEQYID